MLKRVALLWLGAAVLVALAAAVAAGLASGGSAPQTAVATDPAAREPYSPAVLSDPYFVGEQRRNAEALERQCRERRAYCAEAAALRAWLARHGAAQ